MRCWDRRSTMAKASRRSLTAFPAAQNAWRLLRRLRLGSDEQRLMVFAKTDLNQIEEIASQYIAANRNRADSHIEYKGTQIGMENLNLVQSSLQPRTSNGV